MDGLRLLLVDGSPLAAWLVTRVVPTKVQVTTATTLQEAEEVLIHDPPDAVIFNLTPCRIGWRRLVELCLETSPPIPFRCSSALDSSVLDRHELPCRKEDHFVKTIPFDQLKRVVAGLVDEAERRVTNAAVRPCP